MIIRSHYLFKDTHREYTYPETCSNNNKINSKGWVAFSAATEKGELSACSRSGSLVDIGVVSLVPCSFPSSWILKLEPLFDTDDFELA
jgi:hypothetical protein